MFEIKFFELNTRKNSAIKERDRNEALDEIKKSAEIEKIKDK